MLNAERNFEFGPYRLENKIIYDGHNQRLELPEQALNVLQVLLEHTFNQGQAALTSDEIRRKVWGNSDVGKNNLHQHIKRLRKALGATAIVSTSGPRGYQFTFPVRLSGQAANIRWSSLSVLPFVCPPGYFQDEGRLRMEGHHLALGIIQRMRDLTRLEIRELSPEFLQPGWQPNTKQIAHAQRVDLILYGHVFVSKHGDELRLQLYEAALGNVLWTGKFTVNAADTRETEHEIAKQVAEALGYTTVIPDNPSHRVPHHPAAVASCRKGRYIYSTQYDRLDEALDEYTYALTLDPSYAEPWVGIADIWVLRCTFGLAVIPPNEGMPKVLSAANRALELDPNSSAAHASRSTVAALWEWNFELSECHLRRAIQQRPDNEFAHEWLARVLLMRGNKKEAIRMAERGWELAPHLPYIGALLAWIYYFVGQQENATSLCRDVIAQWPMFPVTYAIQAFVQELTGELEAAEQNALTAMKGGETLVSLSTLGCVYGRMGKKAEAENVLLQLAEQRRHHYVSPYYFAVVQAGLGNHSTALQQLSEAFADRSEWMPHLRMDHRLRTLHGIPPFETLMQQVGV